MKWVYSIKYKLQAALVLTIIVFLVFAKNIYDKRNINALGEDFISFYDDRLVVESYIFRFAEQLFLMKLSMHNPEKDEDQLRKDIADYNTNILRIIEDFEDTHLTKDEAVHLKHFKDQIQVNLSLDGPAFTNTSEENKRINTEIFNEHLEEAFANLTALSEIQLDEGEKLTRGSGQIVSQSSLWDQMELAVLIILMVIIYLLIFSSKSIRSKITQNPSLN